MEDQEARRSIVRICFDWKPNSKLKKFMVIAGIILSIGTDGFAVIAADSSSFESKKKFRVNFPANPTGYEETQELDVILNPETSDSDVLGPYEYAEGYYIFKAKPMGEGYIKAVRFDTRPVEREDPVYSFVFPRKGYVTKTGCCRGSITNVSTTVLQYDCDNMHEYGYLGSPLFNESGNLVGITYVDEGTLQAWTVWQLQDTFKHWECTFVSQGNEEPAGAEAQGAEAQVEEGTEAQVEERAEAQVEEGAEARKKGRKLKWTKRQKLK